MCTRTTMSYSQHVVNPLFVNLGEKIVRKNGTALEKVDTVSVLTGKIVGLYFSAHWCGPCRGFTPQLAKQYNELRAMDIPFEVVFVSKDTSREEFIEYYESMPDWFAADAVAIDKLDNMYAGQGIPQLILFNEQGQMITDQGRHRILDESVPFPWTLESKAEKDMKSDLDALLSYAEAVDKADYIYVRKTSLNTVWADDKIGQLNIVIGRQLFVYDFILVRENNPQWVGESEVKEQMLSELLAASRMGDMFETVVDGERVILLSKENAIEKYLKIAAKLISVEDYAKEEQEKKQEEEQEERSRVIQKKMNDMGIISFDAILSKVHDVCLQTEFSEYIETYYSDYDMYVGWSQGWNPGDNDTDFIYSDLGKPQCGKECHHIEFSDGDTVEEKKKKIRDAVDHTKIEWKWGKRNGQKRQYYIKCDGETCSRVWKE